MSNPSDWASRLAYAVAHILPESRSSVLVHSIKVLSSEAIEVIYSYSMDRDLRGIRIDSASVRSASERIRTKSIDELAFYLIHVGMDEPRPKDDFLPADSNGVRWLPLHQWLDD